MAVNGVRTQNIKNTVILSIFYIVHSFVACLFYLSADLQILWNKMWMKVSERVMAMNITIITINYCGELISCMLSTNM